MLTLSLKEKKTQKFHLIFSQVHFCMTKYVSVSKFLATNY